METIFEIEHEKKLLDLFGYYLIGPNQSNRWLIFDENNNQVGFIQYKKIFSKNLKKGYPATFGYHTVINSSTVSYHATRVVNNIENKNSISTKFSYRFDVKRGNDDIDYIEISMDEFPRLNVQSKKYGFIDFKIDSNGLFLNFKSKTENFNVEELVIYKSNKEYKLNHKNEYVYQIRYCDKGLELSDDNLKGTTIREISGVCHPYYQEENQLNLKIKSWINGNLRTNRECNVAGTVEEMAIKHQDGINSFNYFHFFINQILPVKQDVISAMVSNDIVKEKGLSLFITDTDTDLILAKKKRNETATE